jgi:hypothetical protein
MARKRLRVRKRARSAEHPGFENVAEQIARERGVPIERARAMLASSTRRASPAAKRANPRLKRVKG